MITELESIFSNFLRRPGATTELVAKACRLLNFTPPTDYVTVLNYTDGGEGFIGQNYLRLYSTEEVPRLNQAYQVETFAPRLVIFGSNGGGEAFGFDARQSQIEIVQIPFIPLDFQQAIPFGPSVFEFLSKLAASKDDTSPLPQINMSAVGKEVHDILPIVFGGRPNDKANQALVPSEKHAELSVFWNRVYKRKLHDSE